MIDGRISPRSPLMLLSASFWIFLKDIPFSRIWIRSAFTSQHLQSDIDNPTLFLFLHRNDLFTFPLTTLTTLLPINISLHFYTLWWDVTV